MPSSHNFREQIELLDMPPGKKKTLLAAIELFSQQGYAATSTAQIAKKAGVSEATIFKYFKTKAQLLNELLQPLLEQLIPKYQSEFIEKISQQKFVDAKDFTLAVITDRYNFLVANQQLIVILLGQILIDDSLRKNAVAVGLENSQKFNKEFQKIFAQYFDAPELTLFEFFTKIIRLLFGYFMQQKFMNDSLPVEPTHDLEILAQQLLISLTS